MKLSEKLRNLLEEMKASEQRMQELVDNHCFEMRLLANTQEQIIKEQD